jgi:hypothetical protein
MHERKSPFCASTEHIALRTNSCNVCFRGGKGERQAAVVESREKNVLLPSMLAHTL